jgi:hypothetical protein
MLCPTLFGSVASLAWWGDAPASVWTGSGALSRDTGLPLQRCHGWI